MSNNCAMALLVYTLLQIFFVANSVKTEGMSIAPYFGMLLLVALIVPFCRRFEQRWQALQDGSLADGDLSRVFRIDQMLLWALAIGMPLVFVGLFKGIVALI